MDDFYNLCKNNAEKLASDRTILYELSNLDWIASTIIEYNELGFLTFASQPGSVYDDIMYKSEYHRVKDPRNENILRSVIRKQRAYVRGYMHHLMADFIFDKLHDDPYIFVRTSTNNRPVNFEIKFGSVNFIDDQPVLTEEIMCDDIEETKNNPDANWSFNFNLLLRRPMIGNEYIIEFEIVDVRWNENIYMWTKLLEIINEYMKIRD